MLGVVLEVLTSSEERAREISKKGTDMGAMHVTVTIRNSAAPHCSWEGLFLVDTGATDCLVPRPHLEAIGLLPKG